MNAAGAQACFAQSYFEARAKFQAAAEAAGLDVHSHPHPLLGHDGEALAMDVARLGAADASALLLITSACHGVEGFCGSGVQNALLADAGLLAAVRAAGVALVFIHALNPYGFSWWRRTTHENVDLNRNWQDFHLPLPHNAAYDAIAHWLLPPSWPPSPDVNAALMGYAATHGMMALQAAVSGGQYAHPEGLFYGGDAPTWSQQTLRHVLQDHGRRCARLGWIDLHSGLGPAGHGEKILACRPDATTLARAQAWWGSDITSSHDGSSSSAELTGLMFNAAYEECPQAEYTGIALEFGTVPLLAMLGALREDQWYENHPEAPAADRAAARQRMRDAFYVDTPEWKQQVAQQGQAAVREALGGLSRAG